MSLEYPWLMRGCMRSQNILHCAVFSLKPASISNNTVKSFFDKFPHFHPFLTHQSDDVHS